MSYPVARQRVIIYRLGSLGDTVVALPCFHKIAQRWPDAERIVLTNFPVNSKAAPLEVILRDSNLIHSAIAYPVGTRSIAELWRLALRLKQLRADALIYLTPARGLLAAYRDWIFFRLCGFKHIIGTPLTSDLQSSRTAQLDNADELGTQERECERLARCLNELGPIDLSNSKVWDLRLTEQELTAGARALGPLSSIPYFAINMGGKAQEKDWGLNNWLVLLKALGQHYPQAGLLVVGAAEDSERAQAIGRAWSSPLVDACGKLSPRESAAAMRNALAFIGHDSGPLHLAAAAGVRCVGLFGNLNRPRRWHPYGEQHRIIHRMNGLHTITSIEIIHAVQDMLARHAGP